MAVPLTLLRNTLDRAPCVCAYSGPGMRKTTAIHTLPPPIFMYDFEGGAAPLMPWIRRYRKSDVGEWTTFTDEDRQKYYDQLLDVHRTWLQKVTRINPRPYIDVIFYDNQRVESYTEFVQHVGSFDLGHYNSLALDSLQAFSVDVQTYSKGGPQVESHVRFWGGIQERTAMALRRIQNYRDKGLFIYLAGAEYIDKDYITDPRSAPAGAPPEQPYSIKGTVNVPGKMVAEVSHLVDIFAHGRLLNSEPAWITQPEPIAMSSGVTAYWEAKDRFGRLDKYIAPNFRDMLKSLYGEETAGAIYASGKDRIHL